MPTELIHWVWVLWALMALVMLAAIGFYIRLERSTFAAGGRATSWLWVRLASIPAAAAAVAAVVLPSRAVGGPEALGVFYLLGVTLGPLVFFGLHMLVGRFVRPPLNKRESAAVAFTGLMFVLVPALFAQWSQGFVFQVARALAGMEFSRPAEQPLPLKSVAKQRYSLEGWGEFWVEHFVVPEGVQVEHIEFRPKEEFIAADGDSSSYLCRSGSDIHVLWHAAIAPVRWRMSWRKPGGGPVRSEWTPEAPGGPAVPFTIEWKPDGFVLPARLPAEVAAATLRFADGRERPEGLRKPFRKVGEPVDNCLPLEYRQPPGPQALPTVALTLRLWRYDTQQMLVAAMRRPGEPAPAAAPADALPPIPPSTTGSKPQ